jgi:hypothetical protein
MSNDIQNLIAAIQAKQWVTALLLAMKIGGEVSALVSQQPHVFKYSGPKATDVDHLAGQLTAEMGAANINWQNVLSLVQALIPVILPLIIHGGK